MDSGAEAGQQGCSQQALAQDALRQVQMQLSEGSDPQGGA